MDIGVQGLYPFVSFYHVYIHAITTTIRIQNECVIFCFWDNGLALGDGVEISRPVNLL